MIWLAGTNLPQTFDQTPHLKFCAFQQFALLIGIAFDPSPETDHFLLR
jgi:hypothetical protein